ncbi:caspase family protein [Sphaerisporangium flaviroseum]|uniref:caspase family protein n=1 Tax=Sphaerisporangium flaviroseum TaxID=509199 RepID=UPI0031EDA734
MPRRALLIGSAVDGLKGVGNDLDIMESLLTDRRFEIRRHEREDATRDAILAAYRRLIDDTSADDPVVVYYSGHGAVALAPPATAAGMAQPPPYQFIVSYDFESSSEDDFRGITAFELSILLADLTERSRNVTVILDCCYAARMSRDPDLVPRALRRPYRADIEAHLLRRGISQRLRELPNVVSNPHSVRLVACGPRESSFEYPSGSGRSVGVFTESLDLAMKEAQGVPVTWATLVRRARSRVQLISPNQRPEAEGESGRLPFTVEVPDTAGVLPVTVQNGRTVLLGGRIVDVEVGDVYAVLPAGAALAEPGLAVATATVRTVTATTATVDLAYLHGATSLPVDAEAHPVRRSTPLRPVEILGTGPDADRVRAAVSAATHVRPATGDDTDPLASVDVTAGTVELRDRAGPLTPPASLDDDVLLATVRDLNRLARAATVEALESGGGATALDASSFEVECGRVVGGRPEPIPASGTTLFAGERLYVRLRNRDPRRLYFFLFDLGVSRAITLITSADPSGIGLDRDEEWVVGGSPDGDGLVGQELFWPERFTGGVPRSESLIVIVTDRRQELRALEQEGLQGRQRGDASPLENLITQIADGGTRELRADQGSGVRYAVRQFEFLLHPQAAPADEAASFLLDELPDRSLRIMPPPPATPPPGAVTVRLTELISSRAPVPGEAGLRVDAIVLTAPPGPAGGARVHRAVTAWARASDQVSFDPVPLYDGPVREHLDIAIWVSRDRAGAPSLAEMLAQQPAAPGPEDDPPGPPAIGAVSDTAAVVDRCDRLLADAVEDRVALYRAAMLAADGFGAGRHPAQGLLRSGDLSFTYQIDQAVPGQG